MKKLLLSLMVMLAIVPSAQAVELLDTDSPAKFFNLGFRIGVNTSNRTFPTQPYMTYNKNSWGTGFNVGVVGNLNLKEYLSIQPGIFFDSRSGDYSYNYTLPDGLDRADMGHYRTYDFTVSVMAVVKIQPLKFMKVSAEFGPYLQFYMKKTGSEIPVYYQVLSEGAPLFASYGAEYKKFDFGFKMGAGVQVLDHYYFGIHYLAGALHAWTHPGGGHNKSWMFTLGYDL